MPEAVSLFSGSLSSSIATEIALSHSELDRVVVLTFRSPFFKHYDGRKALANRLWPDSRFRSKSVKRQTKKIASTGEELSNGRGDYCERCRGALLKAGKDFIERVKADLLVSGENRGKNPLKERGDLAELDERVGLEGLVFRPLTSRGTVSVAEKENWIASEYENLEAKSRERLENLAEELGLDPEEEYFGSEERCKLASSRYRQRLRDLSGEAGFNINDLRLLDFENYYKIAPDTKVVLGRNPLEKRELHNFFLPRDLRFYLPTREGPMALVRSDWEAKHDSSVEQLVELAARITVAESGADEEVLIPVNYRFEHEDDTYRIDVPPLEEDKLKEFSI